MLLEGSCHCGAVRFRLRSPHPYPFNLCYCSVCRKTAGGGGFAINLMGDNRSLEVSGREALGVYRAMLCDDEGGECETSSGERNCCTRCASALWLYDPSWPNLMHPFASAIDTELPVPPRRTHLMLRYKASWVDAAIGKDDLTFDLYPEQSIEDWHKQNGLWIA